MTLCIAAGRLQIPRVGRFHWRGLVSPLEQVAKHMMASIASLCVGALRPFHSGHQPGLRRFHQQMIMIAHEHMRVNPPAGFLANLSQPLQKPPPILVVLVDGLALIAPAPSHDRRLRRTRSARGVAYSNQLHFPHITSPILSLKTEYLIPRTDPFRGDAPAIVARPRTPGSSSGTVTNRWHQQCYWLHPGFSLAPVVNAQMQRCWATPRPSRSAIAASSGRTSSVRTG